MDGGLERGWSPERVSEFRSAFYEFLPLVVINTKELGRVKLGDHLYRAQERFFDFVFEGLSRDVHDFKHLKSRQLGISTGSRALGTFWLGVHDGLKGYMVFDSGDHMEEARLELVDMIESLPDWYKFPRIVRKNAHLLVLDNSSMINFATAGTQAGRSSGTLGRSSGVNFCHCSEMASWVGDENIVSFKNALAKEFPDRLYLWESTGRGFNLWNEMYEEAKEDIHHQATLFSGWWCLETQTILQDDPDFDRYAGPPQSELETEKIAKVKELYDWDISIDQLAWVRRYLDPLAKTDGDAPAEFVGDIFKIREQSWIESDSWETTEDVFFNPLDLKKADGHQISNDYKTYEFEMATEFVQLKVKHPASNTRSVQLKVWEEPDPVGVYCIAVVPAHSIDENDPRSAIQVLRAYADGCNQVAEYAWPLVSSQQLTWVSMAIAAWYAGESGQVYLILDLNGPGGAVWDEIVSLKRNLRQGYQQQAAIEAGLQNCFRNVKNYLYTRPDSMSRGKVWQWKTGPTGPASEIRLLERFRDFFASDKIFVRSGPTLREMYSFRRDGDSIKAGGHSLGDRVFALAAGLRCWEDSAQKIMSMRKRTRESETKAKNATPPDLVAMFNRHMVQTMLGDKQKAALQEQRTARRMAWRLR